MLLKIVQDKVYYSIGIGFHSISEKFRQATPGDPYIVLLSFLPPTSAQRVMITTVNVRRMNANDKTDTEECIGLLNFCPIQRIKSSIGSKIKALDVRYAAPLTVWTVVAGVVGIVVVGSGSVPSIRNSLHMSSLQQRVGSRHVFGWKQPKFVRLLMSSVTACGYEIICSKAWANISADCEKFHTCPLK